MFRAGPTSSQWVHIAELMNLRVLEWLDKMTSDPMEISVTIQDVDHESKKYIIKDSNDPFWAAQEE